MAVEEHASRTLAGGIVNYGYQCGMLWGASLASGAEAYRVLGNSPPAEVAAIKSAQRVMESFKARTKNEINCLEITDLNMKGKVEWTKILKFFIKGGPIGCFRMIARYAPHALNDINDVLAEAPAADITHPVSCASRLAQKMGASERHTVMAAGLAGGIALSGGACGALGTAIWLAGINAGKDAPDKAMSARANEIIDKFVRSTNFEFECSEIVGRRFEDVADHAAYVREGGCAEILEVLAKS